MCSDDSDSSWGGTDDSSGATDPSWGDTDTSWDDTSASADTATGTANADTGPGADNPADPGGEWVAWAEDQRQSQLNLIAGGIDDVGASGRVAEPFARGMIDPGM